jgi:hypothetical protein
MASLSSPLRSSSSFATAISAGGSAFPGLTPTRENVARQMREAVEAKLRQQRTERLACLTEPGVADAFDRAMAEPLEIGDELRAGEDRADKRQIEPTLRSAYDPLPSR